MAYFFSFEKYYLPETESGIAAAVAKRWLDAKTAKEKYRPILFSTVFLCHSYELKGNDQYIIKMTEKLIQCANK